MMETTTNARWIRVANEFNRYIRLTYGVLSPGWHAEGEGAACVVEAAAAWRGLGWGDDPDRLRIPNIRPLNDAFRDDRGRTETMSRLYALLEDWGWWSKSRRMRFARGVVSRTVREVLPAALRAAKLDSLASRLGRDVSLAEAANMIPAEKDDVRLAVVSAMGAVDALKHRHYAGALDDAAFAARYAALAAPDGDAVARLASEIWIAVATRYVWVES
ncbi:MAG: hypothetical protein QN194_14920 [Armatimonadota bacterium]|nr:hypothetical protein [Armatimonadota bacterium]